MMYVILIFYGARDAQRAFDKLPNAELYEVSVSFSTSREVSVRLRDGIVRIFLRDNQAPLGYRVMELDGVAMVSVSP